MTNKKQEEACRNCSLNGYGCKLESSRGCTELAHLTDGKDKPVSIIHDLVTTVGQIRDLLRDSHAHGMTDCGGDTGDDCEDGVVCKYLPMCRRNETARKAWHELDESVTRLTDGYQSRLENVQQAIDNISSER